MNSIVIIEPLCRGHEHVMFNAALVSSIISAFPKARLKFMGTREHIDLLRNEIGVDRSSLVEWRPLSIPAPTAFYPLKMLGQAFLCMKVCKEAKRDGADIIALSASELTLFFSRIFLGVFFRNVRLTAVLHSLLKYLTPGKKDGFRAQIASRWVVPLALRTACFKRIQMVILSPFIRNELIRLMPRLEPFTRSIDMPYLFPSQIHHNEEPDDCIRFGFAGFGTREKGIDTFFRLANDLHEMSSPSGRKVRFSFIGRLGRDCRDIPIPDHIEFLEKKGPFSQEDFDRAIRRCRCLVYPYDRRLYSLVASAALMDAIRHQKPVIAYRTPFFENYLELMGKEAGRICDNYGELKQAAIDFVRNADKPGQINPDEYDNRARKIFSPEAIAPQLRKIAGE